MPYSRVNGYHLPDCENLSLYEKATLHNIHTFESFQIKRPNLPTEMHRIEYGYLFL
jgi:hypothetical protein